MADLTYIEKANIENFLGMKSGYVINFSDRTFQEFVGEVVGLDINDPKYHCSSNSKANRLRQFIKEDLCFDCHTLAKPFPLCVIKKNRMVKFVLTILLAVSFTFFYGQQFEKDCLNLRNFTSVTLNNPHHVV